MAEPQDRPTATTATRQLNHLELLYRPGERALAIQLFELLGCQCNEIDAGATGRYLVARIEPSDTSISGNVFYLSEMEPEQLDVEVELQQQLEDTTSKLASAHAQFQMMREQRPYRSGHVGLRLPSIAALDVVLGRMESVDATELAGRAAVCSVIHPTVERERDGWPVQAFVWTDVVGVGYLSMGQIIELQGAQGQDHPQESTLQSLPDGVSLVGI